MKSRETTSFFTDFCSSPSLSHLYSLDKAAGLLSSWKISDILSREQNMRKGRENVRSGLLSLSLKFHMVQKGFILGQLCDNTFKFFEECIFEFRIGIYQWKLNYNVLIFWLCCKSFSNPINASEIIITQFCLFVHNIYSSIKDIGDEDLTFIDVYKSGSLHVSWRVCK